MAAVRTNLSCNLATGMQIMSSDAGGLPFVSKAPPTRPPIGQLSLHWLLVGYYIGLGMQDEMRLVEGQTISLSANQRRVGVAFPIDTKG